MWEVCFIHLPLSFTTKYEEEEMVSEDILQKYYYIFKEYFSVPPAYFDGLYYTICSKEELYRKSREPKKNGGFREIHAPCEALKLIQRKLHKYFSTIEIDDNLFAYREGGSPIKNAISHVKDNKGPEWMLKMDLKNAFPSVDAPLLQIVLRAILIENDKLQEEFDSFIGFDRNFDEFIKILISLVTHNERLTQGAPSSPSLLNLSLTYLGIISEIKSLCQKHGVNFSVYSDDFVFTSNTKISKNFRKDITVIIEGMGFFEVNPEKTMLSNFRHRAHKITGVVLTVNPIGNIRFTLPQKTIKTYRGKINRVIKMLSEGKYPTKKEDGISVNEIKGEINWLRSVCGDNLPSAVRKLVFKFENILRDTSP